ncbi:hypothetical protein [Roseibium salinum]|uniref:Uncharacterized protein n=1 Tax=Roseibium salinum TaxID=1604349 RepID=A0ABT3QWK3_9HYPH|nr:hypothetical protein [Roseibium sp. DSM 29163]MCX2721285.1 hypothetical protein [Roseibium sp. DSM 29163]
MTSIRPLVDRTRFTNGDIADDQWLDAYMVGFLTMLITLIAQRRVQSIGSEALGIVQAAAWRDITGLPGELIGEEACLLSADSHGDFEQGCRNAATLYSVLMAQGQGSTAATATVEEDAAGLLPALDDSDIHALWSDYFERPIFGAAPCNR